MSLLEYRPNFFSPYDAEVEVYLQENRMRSLGWADGKAQIQSLSEDAGVCVRVLKDGAQGTAVAKSFSNDTIQSLIAQAQTTMSYLPKDPYRVLFQGPHSGSSSIPIDDSCFKTPSGQILESLAQIEKNILDLDPRLKKIIKMNFTEEKSRVQLINNFGVDEKTENSCFSFVVEILAEGQGQTEVGWDFQSRRFQKDLNMNAIAEHIATHTLKTLGASPISSGLYPVLVHPRVGVQLLSLVIEALSAEAVQLGRSFWRGKKGSSIATRLVHFSDDPSLEDGIASSHFDDEGVPHETLSLVSDGILNDYFYDLRSAGKEGRKSNGRGIKESLASLPKPGSTNFFMKPGENTVGSLLENHPKVFYLHDVMGLHMADPITGEFSLGAFGFLYQNGKYSQSVRGVTIAGSIGEIFQKVIGVSNEMVWYGATAAPHFLVSQMMVAGT